MSEANWIDGPSHQGGLHFGMFKGDLDPTEEDFKIAEWHGDDFEPDHAAIVGLHHAQITVESGDEQRAREFYCGVLGLPEVEKPESLKGRGGFWLQVGDRQVHVGIEAGVSRKATKAHLAYEVADLAYWRERLQGLGIEEGVPIPGYDRFEFRDPFGNRVEMIQNVDR
jgi:catechol 2,3-dioxygenase-like lactoylglutathione lyase family enzyme